MATNDTPSPLPPPSPEHRRIAAANFDRANQVIAAGNLDYGIQLLMTCCRLDPANFLYRQNLRRTQKAKFNNSMNGSKLAFLTTFRSRARLKSARRNRQHLKVLEYGEEILSKDPWDLSVQMDMGAAADALGLSDIAVFIYDQARQKFPKNATLNRALARLFERRGNYAHAINLWNLVKEAAPKDIEAQHKSKDLAASETIQKGGYDSGEKPALGLTVSASGETSKNDKGKEDKPVERVERVEREAAPIIARTKENPTDHNLYMQLAAVYRRYNLPDRARAALEQGLGPTGSHFSLTLEIMELDIEPFRKDLAITEDKIRKSAKAKSDDDDDDENPLTQLHQARVKLLKEISAREIELFRMRAERNPGNSAHRLELGIRLLQAGQLEQAIAELQEARKDQKNAGRASMYLGLCFKKSKKWPMAQRNFEEALNLLASSDESNRKEVLFQLAQGHAEAGDLAKAIEAAHELAHLDFSYKDIGKLIDEWQERLQQE